VFLAQVELQKRVWSRERMKRMVSDVERLIGCTVNEDICLRLSVDLENSGITGGIGDEHVHVQDHLHDVVAQDLFLGLFHGGTGILQQPHDLEKRKSGDIHARRSRLQTALSCCG